MCGAALREVSQVRNRTGAVCAGCGSEAEGIQRFDGICQTAVDVGCVDGLGNGDRVAKGNHGERHLAVTLKHTALHIEDAHFV